MEFFINDEQKIRISLSESAQCVICDDMEYYGIHNQTNFINRIFSNYYPSAKSSISLQIEKENDYLEYTLSSLSLDNKTKKNIISRLLADKKKSLEKEIDLFKSSKGSSKLYRLNNCNMTYLSDNCPEENEDYYVNAAQYIKCVIEEYCSLPFIQRDRIYHKDHYLNIETACKEHKVLKIKIPIFNNGVWENRVYQVHPYKIVSDAFNIQSYLICRSKVLGEEESTRRNASFTISRIKDPPAIMESSFFMSDKKKKELEDKLLHHSPAFLIEETEEIHVKLSKKGRLSFQNRKYSRPVKDETLSSEGEYVFFCSMQQAFNYFISFGPEAEIISPLPLRERFKSTFQKSLSLYT